jgi:dual-specificity kinase
MASTTVTATAPATNNNAAVLAATDLQASRKRRRSREPDWSNFYRNGLPQEVIVIDDSPEPDANTTRKQTAGYTTSSARPLPPLPAQQGATDPSHQPATKRRRREGAAIAAPSTSSAAYHAQYNQQSHTSTPIGSTLSSDGNNSALHTTAPTSLSSNGQYDEVVAPLKLKRTTRQQAAIEAKRRDIEGLGHAFLPYEPPPRIPKKAGEVQVRVVHEVSIGQVAILL